MSMKGRKSYKFQSIFRLVVLLILVLLINIIGNNYYNRIDLTKEKRYSLSPATKDLLNGLDDIVYVRVFLEGNFPAGFKRLRNSTMEMLNEFKGYSHNNVEFIFINPGAVGSLEEKREFQQELMDKGLQPTNLRVQGDEELSQKVIFPGALFNYRGKELPVQLLENQIGMSPQEVLNNSIELLEYKLANSIKKLVQRERPTVLFSQGQGELNFKYLADITGTLTNLQYEVASINLSVAMIPHRTDLLIIAKPTTAFREQEKFKIDQYIMNGGSVLWLIDKVNAEMDSLRGKQVHFAETNNLNLADQLFKYGIRINGDLVQDLQCNRIPLVVGFMGDAPQTELFPWYYYPVVTSGNEHAIVKNLDAISFRFANTIDTVRAKKVNKIPLLFSSQYSKALMAPVRLHFSMLKQPPDSKSFQQGELPMAVLLEGMFESAFKNRALASFKAALDSLNRPFQDESVFSKMIVVGDGDIIANDISNNEAAYPLGYYQFTEQTFANRDFILNCIEYLIDDTRLIETRNKEIKLRLLDMTKVKAEKSRWQLINIASPILVIALFGLLYNWIRKRRYT